MKCKHYDAVWVDRWNIECTDYDSGLPFRRACPRCGGSGPIGEANDTGPHAEQVSVEKRAAELAADFAEGVGLGGHKPDHCTGEHCWHWFEDDFSDEANPCCYCGHDGIVLPGMENDCQSGHLAHAIHNHDSVQEAALTFRMFPFCRGTTHLAPTNRQCLRCERYGQSCDATSNQEQS